MQSAKLGGGQRSGVAEEKEAIERIAAYGSEMRPHSPAERWVSYVIRAATADDDVRTLGAWARLAGVSYSSLRETCYLVGTSPRDSRDFARALRVVLLTAGTRWSPESFVDVSDRRTLRQFVKRTSLTVHHSAQYQSISAFLKTQRLIRKDSPGLALQARVLAKRGATAC